MKKRARTREIRRRDKLKKYWPRVTGEDANIAYEALRDWQSFSCAICRKHELLCERARLFVDHCHRSGQVRGLLCQGCNSGLGAFRDRDDLLESAYHYLQETRR